VIVDQEQTVEKLELVWHHLYIEMIERGEAPAARGEAREGVRHLPPFLSLNVWLKSSITPG